MAGVALGQSSELAAEAGDTLECHGLLTVQVWGVNSQIQGSSGGVFKFPPKGECPNLLVSTGARGAAPEGAAGEADTKWGAGNGRGVLVRGGPAHLSPWGSPKGLWGAGEGKGVLRGCWGGERGCSALTMEPALHTSRVTAFWCCFSRVMAG